MPLDAPPRPAESHGSYTWGDARFALELSWGRDAPVSIAGVRVDGVEHRTYAAPAVEVLSVTHGHLPASYRLTNTAVGAAQRFESIEASQDGLEHGIVVRQSGAGVSTALTFRRPVDTASVRVTLTVENSGTDDLVLRSVASLAIGFSASDADGDPLAVWDLLHGRSDWLGESRWQRASLRPDALPSLAQQRTGHNPKGAFVALSTGTWSTASQLPTAALVGADDDIALAWQIEHNGPWRWEIGEDFGGGSVAVSGPTDRDASWTRTLAPGEQFTTVPAAMAFGRDLDQAVASLTAYRRATRRPHADNAAMPVVFNDYMNTLDGDPTTDRLLPLITAAAEAGAEVFCIDAGWYDDSGDWWDTVGLWEPSATRFPGGLEEVVDAIRAAGMVPGLWLEPEVVGVRSPVSHTLPPEAFLQRGGHRVVEHGRYHLDLRHPAAIAHLDAVVDGLVARFGIGFFKFDYNIDPGAGTDVDADSVGDGLLRHNRAHLDWLDRLLDRHPALVIENCSSGAMRMDNAMLSRLAMQSTSDQQDFVRYPPIAASAPMSMLPEQAASWAYPQPEMDAEEASFALVTGLLGRFYVSGHLNRMTAEQRRRVADAIDVAKRLRAEIPSSSPCWPLGLPSWDDAWIALGLRTPDGALASVWRRGGDAQCTLHLPHLIGHDVVATTVFPEDLPTWDVAWDRVEGALTVRAPDTTLSARLLRLRVTDR